MKWYTVTLATAGRSDIITAASIAMLNSTTTFKFLVEAEDVGGAKDEAMYKFEREYGFTYCRPFIVSVEEGDWTIR